MNGPKRLLTLYEVYDFCEETADLSKVNWHFATPIKKIAIERADSVKGVVFETLSKQVSDTKYKEIHSKQVYVSTKRN